MIRTHAKFFGWLFLAMGVLGFIPWVTAGGFLFGMFHVNAFTNLVHLVTGAALLWAFMSSECASMRTFQVLAVAYGLFGLLGLANLGDATMGPLAMNAANTFLDLVFTAISLYVGFIAPIRHPVKCPA